MIGEFNAKSTEFKRGLVRELLDQCTEPQRDLFNRAYGGIEILKDDQMHGAYYLCERTLQKNMEKETS